MATTCLFLASKVEESPKKLRDVIVETYKVQHTTHQGPESDQDLCKLKDQVLICERELLRVLGFDLSVEHAYRCVPVPLLVPHVPPLLPLIPFAVMRRLPSPRSLVPTRSFVPRRVRVSACACACLHPRCLSHMRRQAPFRLCEEYQRGARTVADWAYHHQRLTTHDRVPAVRASLPRGRGRVDGFLLAGGQGCPRRRRGIHTAILPAWLGRPLV